MCRRLLVLRHGSVGGGTLFHVGHGHVLRINVGRRRRVVSVRAVVGRGSSPGSVSVGRRGRGVCVLLLPGVNAGRVHSEGRLPQASIGGPLMGGGGCRAIICTRAVSFRHQVHKGVIGRGGRAGGGTRCGIRPRCVQDVLVLLADAKLFLDPSLDVGVGHVIGNFPARKGHIVVMIRILGFLNRVSEKNSIL